ncbi:LytR/AlgR family response regulator transcription factor [Pedobacter frigiditerrae]|uniref:LytR/AlgR family response regulator transcription factor n=1 Tax=Pedobacter frigiditerrae TaxID=2530452 RepID=UPI002930765D|nr:response regulator [Pedobacter frigiditerrae]
MFTCYIIDDEPFSINALVEHIDKMPELVLLKSFTNPLLALEEIRIGVRPDIVFLDVDMPELSGYQLQTYFQKIFLLFFQRLILNMH